MRKKGREGRRKYRKVGDLEEKKEGDNGKATQYRLHGIAMQERGPEVRGKNRCVLEGSRIEVKERTDYK